MRCRVNFYEFALIRVPSGGRVAACAARLVVPIVLHPEVVCERGGLNEGETVILVDGTWVSHRDVRMAREMDELRILLAQEAVELSRLLSVGVLVELAVPAVRARIPHGVRERMVREEEDRFGGILLSRGRAVLEDPVALRPVPTVVVSARLRCNHQHMISAYIEVSIHLALVRPAWDLERSCHFQLRGEERLKSVLGFLFVTTPVVIFMIAHDDAHGLARVRVQNLCELDVLVRTAGVSRVAHEEMRIDVGRHGIDGRERGGYLVTIVIVLACADVGVAVNGEADLVAREGWPMRALGLRERGFGLLLGEDEHTSGSRHSGNGCQLKEGAARHAELSTVIG